MTDSIPTLEIQKLTTASLQQLIERSVDQKELLQLLRQSFYDSAQLTPEERAKSFTVASTDLRHFLRIASDLFETSSALSILVRQLFRLKFCPMFQPMQYADAIQMLKELSLPQTRLPLETVFTALKSSLDPEHPALSSPSGFQTSGIQALLNQASEYFQALLTADFDWFLQENYIELIQRFRGSKYLSQILSPLLSGCLDKRPTEFTAALLHELLQASTEADRRPVFSGIICWVSRGADSKTPERLVQLLHVIANDQRLLQALPQLLDEAAIAILCQEVGHTETFVQFSSRSEFIETLIELSASPADIDPFLVMRQVLPPDVLTQLYMQPRFQQYQNTAPKFETAWFKPVTAELSLDAISVRFAQLMASSELRDETKETILFTALQHLSSFLDAPALVRRILSQSPGPIPKQHLLAASVEHAAEYRKLLQLRQRCLDADLTPAQYRCVMRSKILEEAVAAGFPISDDQLRQEALKLLAASTESRKNLRRL